MKRFFDYWIKSRFLSDCKESPNSLHEVLKQIALYGSLFICFLSLAWPTVSNHVTPMSDFAADMLLANTSQRKDIFLSVIIPGGASTTQAPSGFTSII